MMYFFSGVPILCVQWVRPAFSETSSKITGPLFTKPPAVMGRCCSSNCGWLRRAAVQRRRALAPGLAPRLFERVAPVAGSGICDLGGNRRGNPSRQQNRAGEDGCMRNHSDMAASIRVGIQAADIDRKVVSASAFIAPAVARHLSARQLVGDPKPPNLDQRLLARRPDVQALHPALNRQSCAHPLFPPARPSPPDVEVNGQRFFAVPGSIQRHIRPASARRRQSRPAACTRSSSANTCPPPSSPP